MKTQKYQVPNFDPEHETYQNLGVEVIVDDFFDLYTIKEVIILILKLKF